MDKDILFVLTVTKKENAGGDVTYTATMDNGDDYDDAWVESVAIFSNDSDLPDSARDWIAAACRKMTRTVVDGL